MTLPQAALQLMTDEVLETVIKELQGRVEYLSNPDAVEQSDDTLDAVKVYKADIKQAKAELKMRTSHIMGVSIPTEVVKRALADHKEKKTKTKKKEKPDES